MRSETGDGDGYARLTGVGVEVLSAPVEGGLLFVDLALSATDDWSRVADAWRSVAPSVIGLCSRVVMRSPVVRFDGPLDDVPADDERRVLFSPRGDDWKWDVEQLADRVVGLLREHRLPARDVYAFELPLAGEAVVSSGMTPEMLGRCRAVEMEALLRATSALWEPVSYHYQLPSGDHAGSYVRLADVFNDRRAAAALASWLYGSITSSTAVVIDSGTLTPLVDQLDGMLQRASLRLPVTPGLIAVETLDRYPRSRFQYLRHFRALGDVDVLAVLSVSSSGRTYGMLEQSLKETVTGTWRAECLVTRDKRDRSTALAPSHDQGRQPAWLALAVSRPETSAECQLCRNPDRARVVRIDPRTFGAMVLPAPRHEMPDIASASRNASLFNRYEFVLAGAPGILLSPSEQSRLRAQPFRRGDQREKVRFEPLGFLARADVAETITARLDELDGLPARDPAREDIQQALRRVREAAPTAVVCDEEEVRTLAGALGADRPELNEQAARELAETQFLLAAQAVCGGVERVITVGQGDDDTLTERLGDATRFLLLVAGLQTGVTLQHLVIKLQDSTQVDPVITALVVHAHPHNASAWGSVRNTFGGKRNPALLALWLTYIPARSPFAEEHELLSSVQDAWLADSRFGAAERYHERLEWTKPANGQSVPVSPFWSMHPMQLRRTSRFGDLDDRRTFAAMGAAVAESLERYEQAGAPEWVQLDLANALRSYFDGILHASLLRWVAPSRAYWGGQSNSVALIDELAGRFSDTPKDWHLLLAELLLAAALGKVPDAGVETIRAHAKSLLDAGESGDEQLSFVELGFILLKNSGVEHAKRDTVVVA